VLFATCLNLVIWNSATYSFWRVYLLEKVMGRDLLTSISTQLTLTMVHFHVSTHLTHSHRRCFFGTPVLQVLYLQYDTVHTYSNFLLTCYSFIFYVDIFATVSFLWRKISLFEW